MRRSGGGEGERRLHAPRREVGGLKIFLLFFLGQDTLATDDGLGVTPAALRRRRLSSLALVSAMAKQIWKTHHSPLPGARNFGGFRVARTQGTTRRTQRIRTQGAIHVRSREQRSTAMEDLTCRRAHRMIESDTDFYPGSGPSW
jgi:hypothetical protein